MKKQLILLLLGALPTWVAAQDATSQTASARYQPGKWYVGVKYELTPYAIGYRPGVTVGYNITPRMSVQTGVTARGLLRGRPDDPPPVVVETISGEIRVVNSVGSWVYVPLTLRYSFSKPYRRFQPYVLAGASIYFAKQYYRPTTYENGQPVSFQDYQRENLNGFGFGLGFGARVRVVDRLFLNAEAMVNRTRQKEFGDYWWNRLGTGNFAIGILYDFK